MRVAGSRTVNGPGAITGGHDARHGGTRESTITINGGAFTEKVAMASGQRACSSSTKGLYAVASTDGGCPSVRSIAASAVEWHRAPPDRPPGGTRRRVP